MMSVDVIRREIGRAAAGARHAFRGLLGSLDKTKRVQLANLEGTAGEALAAMELFQQFGFSSALPSGTQVIVLPLGGKTSAAVIVASENTAFRFQLGTDGETVIYNQWGDRVHLKAGGVMDVVATSRVNVTAPLVTMSGSLQVVGDITAGGDVKDQNGAKSMSGMRAVFNGHTQPLSTGGTANLPSVGM